MTHSREFLLGQISGLQMALNALSDPEPIVSGGQSVSTYRKDVREIEEELIAMMVKLGAQV
jgi:hypothetical protein